MTPRRWLFLILTVYVLLAGVYSVVTPIFEASDELWHYPMVKYLADNGLSLPRPDATQPWRQEGGQPPLYYLLAAVLTGGIDTSDMTHVRRVNPHADIGLVRPDRNANMIVHRASAEAFPWQGAALAVHVARFFSIALGAATVAVTFALARELFPDWGVAAVGAAALNAFIPMFLFISGSVNNDNLSNFLGNFLTLLTVRLLKTTRLPRWRDYVVLGIAVGAGLLAKLNLGFIIPLVGLALLVASVRCRDWRPLVVGGAVAGSLTLAIAGWWYVRNWQLYGDPTGLNVFLDTVGRRLIPANGAQLWAERHSFTQAFWGFFGGVNVPMPAVIYQVFNLIGGLSLASAVVFLAASFIRRRWTLATWLPVLVTLLWIGITFVSYLRWTAETPASQGRLIYGALSSICVWMAVGLVWWLPRRGQPWIMGVTAAFFAVIAALAPFMVIAPAYAPPARAESATAETRFTEPDATGSVDLLDARVTSPSVRPGGYVTLETAWRVAEPFTRDWSLFVHLTTPDGVIVSQRDVYPGGGVLATSDLGAGTAWQNPVAVPVPVAAYAPTTLEVRIGWYHLPTGARMTLADGTETQMIGQVELLPREGGFDVPNPVSINFDHQMELVGYRLSDLTPNAGDTIDLTLYWRALGPDAYDYTVFAHIIDPRTSTIYASSDSPPDQQTGIIEDTLSLAVRDDTPPGIYELEIGLYRQLDDGSFQRLRIVTDDGGMADDYVYLSRVRVLPSETAP